MKICNKNNKTVEFEEVKEGEVFMFDDEMFIKTKEREGNLANAVRLSDGFMFNFNDGLVVCHVKAKVVIE